MHLSQRKEKPVSHAYFAAFRLYVNHLGLSWRKTQRTNFLRLGAAFLQRRSLPVRRLARTLAGPGKAHRAQDKRLRRFLGNDRLDLDGALGAHLAFVFQRLGAVPWVLVMVDWVFVGDQAILWAHLPYRGRSIPLWVSVHDPTLESDEAKRTRAEKQLLCELRRAWPKDAPTPVLLMDRGFDKGPRLGWLLE